MQFEIVDDFSQALKIELYIDLWRNHDTPVARFQLNGGTTYAPDVGSDWSRTPYIAEIPKAELVQGSNTITFWDEGGGYHVHDVAFRIYHDESNPLLPGPGSDVTPPDGSLTAVSANGQTFTPGGGGTLVINDEEIVLTATAQDARYVEFHAFYDGYDEDNDGIFQDWHNLNRNNFNSGGTQGKLQGGTINHIGTDTTAPYSDTWDVSLIPAQQDVRFKIRVVDDNGNVREAAGGVSAPFTLARTNDVTVETHRIVDFEDAVLHHDGAYPDVVTRYINLPSDLSDVVDAHLIGAYWQNPYLSINGNAQLAAFAAGEDVWALSRLQVPVSYLQPGQNQIDYIYNPAQISFGQFIEKPGPMIVLRRAAPDFTTSRQTLNLNAQTGADPSSQQLGIINSGGGPINWAIDVVNDASWLNLDVVNGVADSVVTVTADPAGLPIGTYTDTLLVSALETTKTEQVTVTLKITAEPAVFYFQDFEYFANGEETNDWLDTDANNSMVSNDSLFDVSTLNDNQTFATSSNASNIHSHYVSGSSETLSNYVYSGRMLMTGSNSGIGVTFLSDYNQTDSYYRLRRYGSGGSFRLSPHGTSISGGVTDSGVVPLVNTWYQFRIEVEDVGLQTNIRAKVWQEGTAEPAEWQIDAYDSSASRLTAGTVGVWSLNSGSKYWDDLLVEPITPPGPHTLTANSSGSGTISADPDAAEYADGTSVALTAVPDAGWTFLEWTGDLSGSNNPATLVMDGEKNVTAVFVEDIPQTVTSNVVGSGAITLSPDQPEYSVGDTVTVTATPDVGWFFAGWSGDLSGITNPTTLVIDSSKNITATFTQEPPGLVDENFNSYGAGANPANWQDTAANNSMAVNDSLFAVQDVNGELALSTSSTQSNIHSHYQDAESAGLSNYVYTGRMRFTANDGGIGVTFLSDYNQTDSYYRLRRYGSGGSFRLSPHGTSISGGVTDSGVVPLVNTWYQFRIEVEDVGLQTNIRAKVWQEGTAEPAEWQIDAYDSSASRLTAGTVGVWSLNSGSKYWDDLLVEPITPPGPHTLTANSSGSGTISADPDAAEYADGTSVALTAVPDAGWTFLEWTGDLSGSNNPATLVMDGEKNVTAVFVEDIPQTVTSNVVGSGAITLSPDQPEYSVGDTVTVTATPDVGWFFAGWSGDLSGITNPTTLVIDSSKNITATFTQEPPGLVDENFNSYGAGANPANWQDTAANNSMAVNDSLFAVQDVNGELALSTSSTQSNIHSHYQDAESAGLSNYVYTGRMRFTANDGGIGVTFLSDYNQTDSYYRLRRYGSGGSFRLSPHGTSISGGVTDSGVVPLVNTWYQFRIEVEDVGLQTNIRAKVWQEGTAEPAEWQIDAYDSSASRLTAGTVGVWSLNSGSKYWDDLNVAYLEPGPFTLTLNSSGSGSVTADPDQPEYGRSTVVTVTAVPDAGWQFDGWSGDLSGSDNPATIIMSGDRTVTSQFSQIPTYTVASSVTGSGTITFDPDQVSYAEGTPVTVTAVPDAGWRFTGWSGDLSGITNPATLVADSNKSITATFVEDLPLTLSVNTVGSGTSTTTPDQATYSYGQPVTITATADSGWRFENWQSDPPIAAGWWDTQWDYRLPLTVDGAGYTRSDAPVEVDLNFTDAWTNLGSTGELDLNSLRVIEVDSDNNVLDTAVPFQFDPSETFDASSNAAGTLVILLTGNTGPNTDRTYHLYFDVAGKGFAAASVPPLVTLTDNVTDEGLLTYRIVNSEATYYYDKQGGGFSSIVDADGNDWIGYNATFGSAGTYRGLPNLVYPEGYMHPGDTNVVSTVVNQGPLKSTIRSTSLDDTWETLWEIYPDKAQLTVIRNDHAYWFLYEGTPGGVLDVNSDIVVRADGSQTFASESWTGDLAGEEWVYFGDPTVGRSLFVVNHQQDTAVDSYYALEGNMTVFGFGRSGTDSYLDTAPATFTVGLVDDTVYGTAAGEIQAAYQPLNVILGGAEAQDNVGTTTGETLAFNITANQVVTATFSQLISPTLTVNSAGSGIVVIDPDLPQYTNGQTVTVTAVADNDWHFTAWSGDQTGTDNPLIFEITDNSTITANFAENVPLTLSANTVGNGSVQLTPDQPTYSYGQVVTVTAVADTDWLFDNWSGDLSGSGNPVTLTMDADKSITATFVLDNPDGPVIDSWYGDQQRYGHIGLPQPWFNVLGNVTDPDGVASLIYSLNDGSPVTLSIGPDNRRLAKSGDFNVDLNYQNLVVGNNQVVITATDTLGNQSVETVTVVYESGNIWPATYTADWSTANAIEDVAQAVDGEWAIQFDGVRILTPDYDRIVAIGDMNWTDYEVTVPITIHEVDMAGSGGVSGGPGLGLLLRWNGHTDSPVAGWQPKTGWEPNGAIGWWRWSSSSSANLTIYQTGVSKGFTPQLDTVYMFKMRVESTPGQGGLYRLKVWQQNSPEPETWDLSYQEGASDVANGSALLLAHHVDATFGNVTVTPLGFAPTTLDVTTSGSGAVTVDPDKPEYSYGEAVTLTASPDSGWVFTGWQGDLTGYDNPTTVNMTGSKQITATFVAETTPPTISDVTVTPYPDTAIITWQTDKPASSEVAYGETSGYELGSVSDSTLRNSHTITLTGLISNTTYHYQITSIDGSGNLSSTANATFTTPDGSNPSGVVSDDFNICTLDTGLWSFVNPVGDGSMAVNGTQVALTVPGGVAHDVWTGGNNAPRLMQTINDTDFEIEVKYESAVSKQYEMQGILVEQDANNYLRFDFYGNNGQVYIFAARIVGGAATSIANVAIGAPGQPLYMRVTRVGDSWTQAYSLDGAVWTTSASFTHSLAANQAGVFAGNAGTSPPAHTAVIDYFFNTASPIVPEDGSGSSLTVNVVGNGSVTRDPDQTVFACGEAVTLTAVPDTEWTFDSWSGDLSGTDNPATLSMDSSKVVTATFVTSGVDTTPPVISNVQVTAEEDSATVTWETNEPASSEVAYGETSGYELGSVSDSSLRSNHAITLTGLISNTTYHYQVTSIDASGNLSSTANATFTTPDGSDPSGIVSDDFNACAVDNGLWSFIDPIGDSSVAVNGSQALLTVPAGLSHEPLGTNGAARLMQPASDEDFEVEAKFESIVTEQYQLQGIFIEQDANDYLRFDFYGSNGTTYIFAARIVNGAFTSLSNVSLGTVNAPMTMRISRVGDTWTQSYSLDGTTWTTNVSFAHGLAVSQVGVFAGNAGASPPAHTAVIDYFFNTASPIVPEDGTGSSLTVNVVGNGSVGQNPDKALYTCGESVELTAVPDADWTFDSWSGDLSGTDNPATLSMDGSKVVTATFVTSGVDTTPPVISNVQVTAEEDSASVTWETNEPASSAVAYGETSGYELGSVSDSTLRNSHTITLTGLISNTTYHYQITSIDGSGNMTNTANATFTTPDGSNPSGVVSDDFNSCTLDTGLWSFVNPVGDGSVAVNGTQVALTVPGGVAHDVWTGGNNAPRLMQTINDTDFEIEVKYESAVSEKFEMQGIIVEQDANNYLRFDFYGNNGQVYIFAARIVGGAATSIANVAIGAPGQPLYMRVTRVGDSWTQAYSLDGAVWTTSASFTHSLAANQAGVFAGNAGTSPPAHTAVIDYFFNTASPIVPEDNDSLTCG